ncbi:MAG TPA: cytochrome c [Burkholderiales bacterium]|nr:cytochrome c [Burkholderiales bacterium]
MRTRSRPRAATGVFLLSGLLGLAATPAGAADPLKGQQTYETQCMKCHGPGGVPVLVGAPNFSRGERLVQPDLVILEKIKAGRNAMPSFRGVLRDYEILDVIAYIRTLYR